MRAASQQVRARAGTVLEGAKALDVLTQPGELELTAVARQQTQVLVDGAVEEPRHLVGVREVEGEAEFAGPRVDAAAWVASGDRKLVAEAELAPIVGEARRRGRRRSCRSGAGTWRPCR